MRPDSAIHKQAVKRSKERHRAARGSSRWPSFGGLSHSEIAIQFAFPKAPSRLDAHGG